MHMMTISNGTCDTGHLHISPLTHSKHRHPQDHEVNHKLKLAKSNVNFYICDEINLSMDVKKAIWKHDRWSECINCLRW